MHNTLSALTLGNSDISASNARPLKFHNAGSILHISTSTDMLLFESDKAHRGWRHQAVFNTGLSTAPYLRNFREISAPEYCITDDDLPPRSVITVTRFPLATVASSPSNGGQTP
jgi:hypothetical protein